MGLFSKIKETLQSPQEEDLYGDSEEEYVELDTEHPRRSTKIIIRPFVLKDFEDTKPILDALRHANTICLINIKPLKDKDIVELKRSINKLKKTCDAIDGEIAGFGENYIVVTPSFAEIYKTKKQSSKTEDPEMTHSPGVEELESSD